MRVISGKYKGRALASPIDDRVRPTVDKVKESIFDVLQFDIPNCKFLDLFAGSGSMGVEAISRGADKVVFVDNNIDSIKLIKKNLTGIDGDYTVLQKDYKDALNSLKEKMDIIFVDAPYHMDVIYEICSIVYKKDLLTDNGYIVYEHDAKNQFRLSNKYFVKKVKQYGIVEVEYIKRTNNVCAVTGSFDPITLGHVDIINKALESFDKVVVVAAQNEEKISMFNLKERTDIIKKVFEDERNILVDECGGYIYKYMQENGITKIFRGYRNDIDLKYEENMANYNKEHGDIDTILVQADESVVNISSTKVKEAIKTGEPLKGLVPKNIIKLVEKIYKEKK